MLEGAVLNNGSGLNQVSSTLCSRASPALFPVLTARMAGPGPQDGPVDPCWVPDRGVAAYARDEDGTPEPRRDSEVPEDQAQGERSTVRVGAQ
eukprot:1535134-Rhodomonas_salina.1